MTDSSSKHTDRGNMSHAEWIARVMDVYDVPIDLIRYEQTIDIRMVGSDNVREDK